MLPRHSQCLTRRFGAQDEKPGGVSLVEVGRLVERYTPNVLDELFDL